MSTPSIVSHKYVIKKYYGIHSFRGLIKVWNLFQLSFRRRPESSEFNTFWMPDHADCKKLSIYSQLQVRHDESGF